MSKGNEKRDNKKGANSRNAELFLQKYGNDNSNNIFSNFEAKYDAEKNEIDENSFNTKSSIFSFINSSCDPAIITALSLIYKKSNISREKGFQQLENSLILFDEPTFKTFFPIWHQIYKRYSFDENQSIRVLVQRIHSNFVTKFSNIFSESVNLFVIPWFLSTCDENETVSKLTTDSFLFFFNKNEDMHAFIDHISIVYEFIKKKIYTFVELSKSKKSTPDEHSEAFITLVSACFSALGRLLKTYKLSDLLIQDIIKDLTDTNIMRNISNTNFDLRFVEILQIIIDSNTKEDDETLKTITKFAFSAIDEKSSNSFYEGGWKLLILLSEKQNRLLFDWNFTRTFWTKMFLLLSSVNSKHIEITYIYFSKISKSIDFKETKTNNHFFVSTFNSINQFLNLTQNSKSKFNKDKISYENIIQLISRTLCNYFSTEALRDKPDLSHIKLDTIFISFFTTSLIWGNQKTTVFNSFTQFVNQLQNLIKNTQIYCEIISKIFHSIFSTLISFNNHLKELLLANNEDKIDDKDFNKLDSFICALAIFKKLFLDESNPLMPENLELFSSVIAGVKDILKKATSFKLKSQLLSLYCIIYELESEMQVSKLKVNWNENTNDSKINNFSSKFKDHFIEFIFPIIEGFNELEIMEFTYLTNILQNLCQVDLEIVLKVIQNKKDETFYLALIQHGLNNVAEDHALFKILEKELNDLIQNIFNPSIKNLYQTNKVSIDRVMQFLLLKQSPFSIKVKKQIEKVLINLLFSEIKQKQSFIIIFEWILEHINFSTIFELYQIELLFGAYFNYYLSQDILTFDFNLHNNKSNIVLLIKSLLKLCVKLGESSKLKTQHDLYLIKVFNNINFYSMLLESKESFFEYMDVLKINQTNLESNLNEIVKNKPEVILDLCAKICFLPTNDNSNDQELGAFINHIKTFRIILFQPDFPIEFMFQKYSNNDEFISWFSHFLIIEIFLDLHRSDHFLAYIFKYNCMEFYTNILKKIIEKASIKSYWVILLYRLYQLKIWHEQDSAFSNLILLLSTLEILSVTSNSPKLALACTLFGSLTNYEHITDLLLFYIEKFEKFNFDDNLPQLINSLSILNSLFGNFLSIKSAKDRYYDDYKDQFIWCLKRIHISENTRRMFQSLCELLKRSVKLDKEVDFHIIYPMLTLYRHSIHIYVKFEENFINEENAGLFFGSLRHFSAINMSSAAHESFLRCLFEIKNIVLLLSNNPLLNVITESNFGNDICFLMNFPSFPQIDELINSKSVFKPFKLESYYGTLYNTILKEIIIIYTNSVINKANSSYLNILTNIVLLSANDPSFIFDCLKQSFPNLTCVDIYNMFLADIFRDNGSKSFVLLIYMVSLLQANQDTLQIISLFDSFNNPENTESSEPTLQAKLRKTIATFEGYNTCKDIFYIPFPRNSKGVENEIQYSFKIFKFCHIFMDIISILPLKSKITLLQNANMKHILLNLLSTLFEHLPVFSNHAIPKLKLASFKSELNCKNVMQLNILSIIRISNECPSLLCEYIRNLEHKKINQTRQFCLNHICPSMIHYQINSCIAHSSKDDQLTLIPKPTLCKILVRYEDPNKDFFDVNIQIPPSYPFEQLCVEPADIKMIKSKKLITEMIKLQHFILSQRGTLLDGIRTWKRNMDKLLQGAEPCAICYTIIHSDDCSLPTSICAVCQKGVHYACLTQWFISSGRKLCPTCRSNFY